MAKRLIIKTTRESGQYVWAELTTAELLTQQGSQGTLADLKQFVGDEHYQLIFLAPASDVLIKRLEFTPKERKHLLKTVPYLLEEQLISDIDELHIVNGKPQGNTITVAAVDEENMEYWLGLFAEAGLTLSQCLPEQMALLPQQNWSLFYRDEQYLFRDNKGAVYAIDKENIALAMQLATEQFAELPGAIDMYVTAEADAKAAVKGLPDALHHLVTVTVKPLPVMVADQLSLASTWNFLQGKFARTAQWAAIWLQWRDVIIVSLIALLVHTGVSYANYQQLEAENLALRQEMERVHRMVFPKGQIVDSRRQIETELKRLRGGSSGGFVLAVEKIGKVLRSAAGLQVNSVSFDDKNGDIRLDLIVDNFQEVEKIKTGVEKQGMEAELLNSNAQGQQVRARLRIKG